MDRETVDLTGKRVVGHIRDPAKGNVYEYVLFEGGIILEHKTGMDPCFDEIGYKSLEEIREALNPDSRFFSGDPQDQKDYRRILECYE